MDLFGLKQRKRKQEIERLNGLMRQHGLILVRKDSFSELASLFNLTGEDITLTNLVDLDPWAKRGVDLLCNTAKVIPWKVIDRESLEDIERGDVIEWIKDPAYNQSREDFVYEALGWLVVCGRFLASKENAVSGRIRNSQLLIVPTNKSSLQIGLSQSRGFSKLRTPILKFLYESEPIAREDCVYTYLWSPNPKNRYWGSGLLPSAQYDLGANVAAAEMSYELMKKGGVPPYYMSTVEVLSDDEFGQVKTQIHSLIKGATNIKNVPMLPGGFEIKSVQLSAKEMQLLELRKHNREAIATSLGMSIAMLTSGITTFENQKQAKVLMYESVIKPLLNKMLEAINRDFIKQFEPKQKVVADYSVVRALEPDYAGFAQGIPNMLRIMSAEGVNSLAPWDLPDEYMREAQAIPMPSPQPVSRSAYVTGLLFDKSQSTEGQSDLQRNEERKEYWYARKTDQESYARTATGIIRKLYRQQKTLISEYIETLDDDLEEVGHVGQWVPWEKEREKFADRMHRNLLGVVKDSGKKIAIQLGGEFELNTNHTAKVTGFANAFAKHVNDTTYSQLDEMVRQILAGERSLSQIVLKVTGDLVEIEEPEEEKPKKELLTLAAVALYAFASKVRAPLAGHDETHNAQGYGIIEGGRSAGADEKDWICAFNNSRPEHEEADGQKVGIDEPFMVMGEAIMWPGEGSVENSANCQCTIAISVRGK
jgi:HK97 family phage portal protein